MICKNCGFENPDGMEFCQNCGKRVDGKKTCPSCGKVVENDVKFCGFCGAKIADAAADSSSEIAAADGTAAKNANGSWKKIVEYIGLGFLALAAIAGFIFTFTLQVSVEMGGMGISIGPSTAWMYDYFYEAYDGVTASVFEDANRFALFVPDLFGTIISAGAIVCNIVFATLAIINAVKRFVRKNGGEKFEKYAVMTYLSFAAFATAFLALHYITTNVKTSSINSSGQVVLGGAAIAGLVIGGIGLAGYYFCRIACGLKNSSDNTTKSILSSAFALGIAVFSVVVIGLLSCAVTSVKYTMAYGSGFSKITQTIKFSLGYGGVLSLVSQNGSSDAITIALACSVIGYVAQVGLIAVTAIIIGKSIENLCKGEGTKGLLGLTIASTSLSVVNLICAIVCGVQVYDSIPSAKSLGYVMPIVVMILNVLILAAVIVSDVLSSRKNGKSDEQPVAEQPKAEQSVVEQPVAEQE